MDDLIHATTTRAGRLLSHSNNRVPSPPMMGGLLDGTHHTRPRTEMGRRTHLVLLAAADPALRAVLQRALALDGYAVLPVADGPAALCVAQVQRPAVIVLDVALTDLDSVTVAWRLRTNPRTAAIPLIAVDRSTAWPPSAPLLPVQTRLATPLDLAQLYQAVARWSTTDARPAVGRGAGLPASPTRCNRNCCLCSATIENAGSSS